MLLMYVKYVNYKYDVTEITNNVALLENNNT